MKSLILAAAVAIGVAFTAGTADAQYRRSGVVYSYPSYGYSYAPAYGGSYYAPSYYGSSYSSSSYYAPSYAAPSSYDSGFYNQGYYNSGYNTGFVPGYGYSNYPAYGGGYNYGYNNMNYSGVTPSGVYLGGARVIRW